MARELWANEVAISEQQYKEFLTFPDRIKTLEEANKKLSEEVENKTKGIEERKNKYDELKKQSETEKAVLEEKVKGYEDKLWGKSIDDVLAYAKSHEETLEKEKEARIEKIQKMETLLWKEFMDTKASLFEWLDESKKENLLKEFMEAKGLKMEEWQQSWNPNPTTPGNPPKPNPLSEFDQKFASGASSKDLFNSLT